MGRMNIYITYLFFGPPFYAFFAPYDTHNITSSRRANESWLWTIGYFSIGGANEAIVLKHQVEIEEDTL
jgi:hypothetical protein